MKHLLGILATVCVILQSNNALWYVSISVVMTLWTELPVNHNQVFPQDSAAAVFTTEYKKASFEMYLSFFRSVCRGSENGGNSFSSQKRPEIVILENFSVLCIFKVKISNYVVT